MKKHVCTLPPSPTKCKRGHKAIMLFKYRSICGEFVAMMTCDNFSSRQAEYTMAETLRSCPFRAPHSIPKGMTYGMPVPTLPHCASAVQTARSHPRVSMPGRQHSLPKYFESKQHRKIPSAQIWTWESQTCYSYAYHKTPFAFERKERVRS